MVDDNPMVLVKKFTTHFTVSAVSDTCVICNKPFTSINGFLKTNLIEYDFDAKLRVWRQSYQYFFFNKRDMTYHMPINLLTPFLEYIRVRGVVFEERQVDPPSPIPARFDISHGFALRDHQVAPVEYLTKGDESISSVELTCGAGKTFMSILSMARMRVRALIVIPSNLHDQWITSLATILPEEEVYSIKGWKSVQKAIDDESVWGVDGPSIFIASNRTLASYAKEHSKYEEFIPFESFISKMRFGVKVIDEIHMGFGMNVSIDLRCNISKNIYLSATYLRTSKNSKRIFDKVFPVHQRFIGEREKSHVNLTELSYYITSSAIPGWATDTNRGYSQFKYEDFILKEGYRQEKIVNKILKPAILAYFIRKKSPGQKLLIIVGKREFAYFLESAIADIFHDLKVSAFLAEHDSSVLLESDIIISTIKSMGTGKDVKGMKTLICFSSIASEVQNLQLIGRLRNIPGENCEFVSLVNRHIKAHGRHASRRREIFSGRVRRFISLVM